MKAMQTSFVTALLTGVLATGCGVNLEPADPGARLFSNNCAQCHGPDGGGNQLVGAPSIAGLPGWYVERQVNYFYDGLRGAHPDDPEGLRMRPMARTFRDRREQIPVVSAYVESLPAVAPARDLEGGDAEAGKLTYQGVCQNCHGADGEGMVKSDLYPDLPNLAPSLTIADDWYMLSQLKKFKGGIRGSHPDDKYGTAMANMALTLADENAMLDVIAYIKTLPGK